MQPFSRNAVCLVVLAVGFASAILMRPEQETRLVSAADALQSSSAEQKADKPATGEAALAERLKRLPPVEPADALATFRLERGFSLELVACEPAVSDPVDACFDEFGRMYVAEMHGYPYSPEPRAQDPSGRGKPDDGIIRLLEDTDGDGLMDRSIVFADKITWPTSVCCYDGGVFVIAPEHLHYFKDTTSDGVADVREILFSGFSRANVQGLANNLKWGLDNRIYGAGGTNGADVTQGGKPVATLRRSDFAIDPKTRRLSVVSGGLQFGHSMDDWGNRFVCSNSNHMLHVALPAHYLERNPLLTSGTLVRTIAKEGGAAPVYRRSPPEPWRIVRTERRAADPSFRSRLPATELVPVGFFTSATGVTIYRGAAYPPEFRGNAFIGDVGGNLVHRKTVEPAGISFVSKRADEETEFLTSTDTWFRPVNFVNAPDGTLYILDMYRETIEHPVSIPEDIKAHLDLESGHDRGRIWRLAAPGGKRMPVLNLGKMTASQLVEQLDSPNSWNRETAQRLLWERQDKSAIAPLAELYARAAQERPEERVTTRLHVLHTLDGLGALPEALLLAAMDDADPHIREHAVQLSEPLLKTSEPLRRRLAQLAGDPHPRVRLQVAFSLGEFPEAERFQALAATSAALTSDADIRIGWLSSIGSRPERMLTEFLNERQGRVASQSNAVLLELATMSGLRNDPSATHSVLLALAAGTAADEIPAVTAELLNAFGKGLQEKGNSIGAVLEQPSTPEQARLEIGRLFQTAARIAQNRSAEAATRTRAIALLAHADYPLAKRSLIPLLSPLSSQQIQSAVIAALGAHRKQEVPELLLASWSSHSPQIRVQIVDLLLSRAARIEALLAAVKAGTVKPGEIDREKKQLLLNHPDSKLRDLAQDVLSSEVAGKRADVVAAYQPALQLTGDETRGRMLFVKRCSGCHKAGSEGHQVGPELASTKNKSPDDLLLAILDPNREAQPNFMNYTIVTQAGKIITGMIATETGNSITLRRAEGKEDVVLRDDIETLVASGVSLMPEGLEKDISQQDLADIISFVKTIVAPAAK